MDRHYTKENFAALKLFTLEENVSGRILRGRALYNDQESEMTFVENAPRGPRSREVGRTVHARMVRRRDGNYTITFRVNGREKWLRAQLIAEIREFVDMIENGTKAVPVNNKK